MSKTNWDETIQQVERINGDRRTDRRYDLTLDLRWKLIRRRRVLENGFGRTVDFSSGGILFETDRPMPVGLNVELSIAWPVLLHNVAQLQLVVSGRIVRSQGMRTAIRMVQHEFRTAGALVDTRNVASGAMRAAAPFFQKAAALNYR